MFSIYLLDSSKLFQWDLNRKIKIIGKEEVDEVHFSHVGDEEALVVKPIKENNILIANIPNILLQESKDIFVYLVSKDKTLKETFFTVGRREKPTDYLYTEIDILNYSSLEKRLAELEEKLNNIPTEETDPTVPDWAKQPNKPRYTAAEVGALSSTETVRQLAQKQDKSNLVTSINASSADSTYPSTRAVYEYVGEEFARLIGSAPDALDTIEELANAFNNNQDILDALNTSITNKQDKTDSVGVKTTQGGEIFNNYNNNIASALYAHAEGESTESSGIASHSEGGSAKATGDYSHAEGCNADYSDQNTTASGIGSHAEGRSTQAIGNGSHAEGESTVASGWTAHAEGYDTRATGDCSHSEGNQTQANGSSSHAEGFQTKASGQYQHVQGKFNVEDTANKYAHIVGNGENDSNRSNAHTLDWNGNAEFKGDVVSNGCGGENPVSLVELSEKVNELQAGSVQPDWNQNDEESLDFIRNRTHYDSRQTEIKEINITWDGSIEDRETVSTGESILVKVSEEPLSYKEILGSVITLISYSNPDSSESIKIVEEDIYVEDIVISAGNMMIGSIFEDIEMGDVHVSKGTWFVQVEGFGYVSSLTNSVEIENGELKKLDEKYLPKIPKKFSDLEDDLYKISLPMSENGEPDNGIEGKIAISDGNGGIQWKDETLSDWNALQGEPGHILNRTHYEAEEMVVVKTILEDNGHEHTSEFDNDRKIYETSLFAVSSEDDFLSYLNKIYCVKYNNKNYYISPKSGENSNYGYYLGNGAIAHLSNENNGLPFFIYVGWYGTVWLLKEDAETFTIGIWEVENKNVVHQLDEKFIPNTIARKEDIEEAIADKANAIDLDNKITTPSIAKVGQILEVEEVDENGKPIKWKAANQTSRIEYITHNAIENQVINPEDETQTFTLKSVGYVDNHRRKLYKNSYFQIYLDDEEFLINSEEFAVNENGGMATVKDKVLFQFRELNVLLDTKLDRKTGLADFVFKFSDILTAPVTVSAYYKQKVYHQLDENLIPSTVPVIFNATKGQFLKVKSVDENGKPITWEASDKPTYTAEEVGALSADTEIPSIEGLATEEYVETKVAELSGTVEITDGEPTKVSTVMTLNPNAEEVNLYTAEEIDAMFDAFINAEEVAY